MADPQHRFQIIQGGSGRAEKSLIDTGTVGQDKPALTRPKASGGGRGGGSQAVSIAKLETHVRVLWIVVAVIFSVGLAAIGGSYVGLRDHIDDKYDKVTNKQDQILRDVGDLRVVLAASRSSNETTTPPEQVRPTPKGNDAGRSP